MTIIRIECVTLACSGCGQHLVADDCVPHFDTIEQAREHAEVYDWWTDGTEDLCENCKIEPHPYAPATDAPWSCTRCSSEAEDHDGNAPVAPPVRVMDGQLPLIGGAE